MIDIKTIKCPQCGAPSDNAVPNSMCTCSMCGSTYVVTSDILGAEQQCDGLYVATIASQYGHNDFIKNVLTAVAAEDSPADIFDCTVGQVEEIDHQIYINKLSCDYNYSASIGYDRQEPYTVEEKYWDKNTNKHKMRTVTKYKKVTDWQAVCDNGSGEISKIAENGAEQLDSKIFVASAVGADMAVVPLDNAMSKQYSVSNDIVGKAEASNRYELSAKVRASLPGDHVKDYKFNMGQSTINEQLYLTKEYRVALTHNGNSYTKSAFPFGNMVVGGDKIVGGTSDTDSIVWGKTKLLHIATTLLLTLSILLSLLTSSTASILVPYFVAVAVYIVTRIVYSKVNNNVVYQYNQQKQIQLANKVKQLGLDNNN